MASSPADNYRKMVNASGFAFQIAVEHEVTKTKAEHGWEVLAHEHPWSVGHESGFADLILGRYPTERLVVECKRPRGATWIFLVPDDGVASTRFRLQWMNASPNAPTFIGWSDFTVKPASYESGFCIVRGQGEGETPLLERLSSKLTTSLAAIAREEMDLLPKDRRDEQILLHLPVIVTTAELIVCRLKRDAVDLSDGELKAGEGKFEQVPFIRFRKTLAYELTGHGMPKSLAEAAADKERMVFVVHAAQISSFLRQLLVTWPRHPSEMPWEQAKWWMKHR